MYLSKTVGKKLFTKSPYVTEEVVVNSKSIMKTDMKIHRIWAPLIIEGKDIRYEVSTLGEVRDIITGEILRQSYNRGYLQTGVYGTTMLVHRLVAMAFIPVPKRYLDQGLTMKDLAVHHKNHKRWNNVVTNLDWCTQQENNLEAKEAGVLKWFEGDEHPRSIVTNEQIEEVCQLLQEGYKVKKIERMTGVSNRVIVNVKYGTSWRHISKKYNFQKPKKQNHVTEETIRKICVLLEKKYAEELDIGFQEIGRKFHVTGRYVSLIYHHDMHTHISKDYYF